MFPGAFSAAVGGSWLSIESRPHSLGLVSPIINFVGRKCAFPPPSLFSLSLPALSTKISAVISNQQAKHRFIAVTAPWQADVSLSVLKNCTILHSHNVSAQKQIPCVCFLSLSSRETITNNKRQFIFCRNIIIYVLPRAVTFSPSCSKRGLQ